VRSGTRDSGIGATVRTPKRDPSTGWTVWRNDRQSRKVILSQSIIRQILQRARNIIEAVEKVT
jgi:hypothetical protein